MNQSIGQKFNVISLLRFAAPSIIMMVFMSLYTIIDGFFIARYAGSAALSAANIVYPVVNVLYACGIMFATGGSAIVAKKLGQQNFWCSERSLQSHYQKHWDQMPCFCRIVNVILELFCYLHLPVCYKCYFRCFLLRQGNRGLVLGLQ